MGQPTWVLVADSYSVVIPGNHPASLAPPLKLLSEQARAELVEVRSSAEQRRCSRCPAHCADRSTMTASGAGSMARMARV
jgi:hypothetical protein